MKIIHFNNKNINKMNYKKYQYLIGIDTGVNTGYCQYDTVSKKIITLKTLQIHRAMSNVIELNKSYKNNIYIRVEDARLRTWFGKSGREQLQGAGSIKRDAKIWEDFLTDLKIPFELVAPKNNKTKINAEIFKNIFGWNDKCSEHARDACMLVFGF